MLFAIIAILTSVPTIYIAPTAGSVVDRFNRNPLMLAEDIDDAILTAIMAVLVLTNTLPIWHIYTLVIISTILGLFL